MGLFNLASIREWFLRRSFSSSGLSSTTTDLGDGTILHCWVPQNRKPSKPNLILIHGLGATSVWQWNQLVPPLSATFNLFVPDLVFFGSSHSSRGERSEWFQARCVAALMESLGVLKAHVCGLSYGGFVAYSLAAEFEERVERVVICCGGVSMEESDMSNGMFRFGCVEEAISVLIPQTPSKARDLINLSFYRPVHWIPTCFLRHFIQLMCVDKLEEKKQLVQALHKDRKMSDLPKISQPTLLIWGEHDVVFPIELAYRLKRHIDENSEIVIIKEAGHAINVEKPKEIYTHLMAFLSPNQDNHANGCKVD